MATTNINVRIDAERKKLPGCYKRCSSFNDLVNEVLKDA